MMQIILHTVTSLMSAIDAPRQRPVDMAPQPEYKSNKVHSFLRTSPLTLLTSSTHSFDPDSLEIVEDVSLSILVVSGLSSKPN